MENQKHVENVINRTFDVIKEVYNNQREVYNGSRTSSAKSRIIFPNLPPKKKNEKGKETEITRISEQELRSIFIEQLYVEINGTYSGATEKWDVYYSVETPTKGDKYCFPQKEKPYYNLDKDKDGKGDSANFDLVIFDNELQRIALIEFKANNRGNHEKDILKLNHPKELDSNPLRYFIEIVKSADSGTYKSLNKKIKDKGDDIIFRCWSLEGKSGEKDITNKILHSEENK